MMRYIFFKDNFVEICLDSCGFDCGTASSWGLGSSFSKLRQCKMAQQGISCCLLWCNILEQNFFGFLDFSSLTGRKNVQQWNQLITVEEIFSIQKHLSPVRKCKQTADEFRDFSFILLNYRG